MKRLLRPLLLLAALTALLSVSVFADSGVGTGFFDIGRADGVTITPDGSGRIDVIWGDSTEGDTSALYQDSEKLTVKLSGTEAGKHYFIELTTGNNVLPTEENMFYMDQQTATGSTTTFTVFPKQGLAESGEMTSANIFITSNADGFVTRKIPLGYANNVPYVEPEYLLGDVDEDKDIDPTDALWALQGFVTSRMLTETQEKAADVDTVGGVTPTDALWILQRFVTVRNDNWEKIK